jgi:hypothetical protein
MLELLIWIIGFGIIAYIAFLVIGWLPLPEPIKKIVIVVLAGVALIAFLQAVWPFLSHAGHLN